MNLKILSNQLNASALLAMQNKQYADKIILSDSVPAGQSHQAKAAVSNLGHFYCGFLTGRFWTLQTVAAQTIDDGINHLRGQLIDGAGQRKIFDDYIPFDLFLSPGRVKGFLPVAGVDTITNNLLNVALVANAAAPSNTLFYPFELEYLFSANSDIIMDVKNDSNIALSYDIVFHGIRILGQ